MLVLAAFRDRGEEVGPALADTLADLSRLDGVTRLTLGNLSDDEVGAFIRASTDAEATARARGGDRRADRRDAAPALRALARAARRAAPSRSRRAACACPGRVAELRGPERIRDVVRQRLSRARRPRRSRCVELAAVAGPRFELRVLAEAAGLDRDALATARRARRSRRASSRSCRSRRRRAASRTSSCAAPSTTGSPGIRRAELHLRVGEALERVHAADPTASCPSSPTTSRSPRRSRASSAPSSTTCAPGHAAVAAAAYDEGTRGFSTALELGIADRANALRVQVELGFLLRADRASAERRTRLFDESLDAADGAGERGVAAHVLLRRGECSRLAIQRSIRSPSSLREEAVRTFGRARRLARRGGRQGRHIANALQRVGRVAECCEALERALVHAEASGDRPHAAAKLTNSLCLLWPGRCRPSGDPRGARSCSRSSRDDRARRPSSGLPRGVPRDGGRFDEARGRLDERRAGVDELYQALQLVGVSRGRRPRRRAARRPGRRRAGADREVAEVPRARETSIDARAMHAAYQLALPLLRRRTVGGSGGLPRLRPRSAGADVLHARARPRLAARARVAAHRGELARRRSSRERSRRARRAERLAGREGAGVAGTRRRAARGQGEPTKRMRRSPRRSGSTNRRETSPRRPACAPSISAIEGCNVAARRGDRRCWACVVLGNNPDWGCPRTRRPRPGIGKPHVHRSTAGRSSSAWPSSPTRSIRR